MIERVTSRAVMIEEAEKELEITKRQIANGFLEGMGYTKKEMQNLLDLAVKDVQILKNEISFEEYRAAYDLVHGRKVV